MKINTIAVFGASGRTGIPFIKKAVEVYKIRALVRSPAKLSFSHPNLEIIKGDVLNASDITHTIEGTQAVVSLLGHTKGSPPNLQTEATRHIIAAMKAEGIQRLVLLTGAGVRDEEHDDPKFMDKAIVFIMKHLAGKGTKNALMDGIRHAEIVRETDLDWTIVRGPMLTEDAPTGKINVGYVGKVPGIKLTRADLASFILDVLQKDKHIKDMPFLANKK